MRFIRHKRKRRSTVTKHYKTHKETARRIISERLSYWSECTGYVYQRVAIRNQKSRWGSCTEGGNLNFSYKLMFLPPELMDYIIVHELCHTEELNHSRAFWHLVASVLPDYRERQKALRIIEKAGWRRYLKALSSVRNETGSFPSPYARTVCEERVK